ncbi:hypothetical protein BYT27DRAFT_6772567 [Phlegmacium glaucopus]|nr:hypothetical protein BYT27DRAFT_6772567 [Phlegmacium glaucopus]
MSYCEANKESSVQVKNQRNSAIGRQLTFTDCHTQAILVARLAGIAVGVPLTIYVRFDIAPGSLRGALSSRSGIGYILPA